MVKIVIFKLRFGIGGLKFEGLKVWVLEVLESWGSESLGTWKLENLKDWRPRSSET